MATSRVHRRIVQDGPLDQGIVVRLDRLIEQTVRTRTEDTARMADIERRLAALEERQPSS